MTLLAALLLAIGCLVVGMSLSTRALARDWDTLDRKRLQLDFDQRRAVEARETYERLAAELRGSLHLDAPSSGSLLVVDLGAHRRKRGLLS